MGKVSKRPEAQKQRQKLIFVTGGAKSGKSSFALEEAEKIKGRKVYIATAEALDDEMRQRIERHRMQRNPDWDTCEEPLLISEAISKLAACYNVILLDCLTLWLSNAMHRNADIEREIDKLLKTVQQAPGVHVYIVSNEVGTGIVPENELAREFRDLAGSMNQRVAGASDEVFMVVAGIPVKIKG